MAAMKITFKDEVEFYDETIDNTLFLNQRHLAISKKGSFNGSEMRQ